ncbi:unnamed protein product [Schistocephalus solidus]|uniref:Uncharacterized protein n=1 Tax=Schistocephalus solidus TaxID=70667 RepID=A0A183SK16_SCHSO|nr:unnamed protein product [Schistocephalus solidus]
MAVEAATVAEISDEASANSHLKPIDKHPGGNACACTDIRSAEAIHCVVAAPTAAAAAAVAVRAGSYASSRPGVRACVRISRSEGDRARTNTGVCAHAQIVQQLAIPSLSMLLLLLHHGASPPRAPATLRSL